MQNLGELMKNGYIDEEYQGLKDGLIQILNSGKNKHELICDGRNPKRWILGWKKEREGTCKFSSYSKKEC
jgi:hypothetical protein